MHRLLLLLLQELALRKAEVWVFTRLRGTALLLLLLLLALVCRHARRRVEKCQYVCAERRDSCQDDQYDRTPIASRKSAVPPAALAIHPGMRKCC